MPECRSCGQELSTQEGTVICGSSGPLWRICTDCYPEGPGDGRVEERTPLRERLEAQHG